MDICFLMVRHPPTRKSPILPAVARLLSDWGARVEFVYPDDDLTELAGVRARHDLYVLKSGTETALSLAAALHAVGAAILNPYPISAFCRDKIAVTRVLQEVGMPVPDTFVTRRPADVAPLLDSSPVILKPYRGSQGRGIQVIWDTDELDDVPLDHGPILMQRYHKHDERDRKIYCIGGQLFGVMRTWPARTYDQKIGEPFTLTPELHEIALGCGAAFGLDLYGLDVIVSDGHPLVVDFCCFPGFKGVPDAALRLADYIYAAAQRVMKGEFHAGAPHAATATAMNLTAQGVPS